MPPSLNWRASARADFLDIISYIADDNLDAAQVLKDEIQMKAAQLLAPPKLYKPGRRKGAREMVIRPNYVVIYRETRTEVAILRVLYAARQRSSFAEALLSMPDVGMDSDFARHT